MPISNLTLYKLLFIIEILTAEFLFTFRLKKRKYYVLRALGCIAVLLTAALFFPEIDAGALYSSFMFLTLFALTIPALWLCYAEPWKNVIFCAVAAYTLPHFAYELASLALSVIVWGKSPLLGMYDDGQIDFWAFDKESILLITVYVLCYFLSYWLIYAIFGRKIKKGGGMRIKSLSLLLLIGAGLIVDIVLNSVVIYSDMSFENSLVNYITNLMCCILLLYSQFGLLLNKELEGELQTMQQLLNQDKEQYASLKENIDLINMKCHDMRHQIREIGISKSLNSEVIDEMEKSITLYDTMVKTGNEALDVILSEKSLLCYRKGIVLTCVADGGRLDFMSATDLYSLFGNALDNAIEAVMKIDDPDGRIIGLRIHAVGQMVTINLKNSFVGEVELDDDGFPVTTKEDKRYHGFGLKSIRYVVEKYDGSVAVQVEDGMFNLNVLVPLPSQ